MRVGCIEDRWIVLTRILDRACFVLGKSFLPISIVYTYLFQGLAIARRTLGFRLLQSFLELALRLFLPVFLVQILPFMFVADMRDVAGACAALRRRRVAVDVRRPCSAHRDGGRQCGSPFFFWASWPRGPAAPGLRSPYTRFLRRWGLSPFSTINMSMIFAASRASLRAAQAPSMALRRSLHIENTVENVRIRCHTNLSRLVCTQPSAS